MQSVRMMAVLLLVVVQTAVVVPISLGLYKSCLYECLHCVDTWGKDLFNGELCADNCALSSGASIDASCANFFTRASRRVSASRQYLRSPRPPTVGVRGGGYPTGRSSGRERAVYGPVYGARSRSTLSKDCQRLCRACESRFSPTMNVHTCLYTCVSSNRANIVC